MNTYDMQTQASSIGADRTCANPLVALLRAWLKAYVAQYEFRHFGKVDVSAFRLRAIPLA